MIYAPTDPIRPTAAGHWPQLKGDWTCFTGAVCLGNSTMYRMGIIKTRRGMFIGIEGRGAYEFHGSTSVGYTMQKLGLEFEGDAAAVSDLLNYLMGCFPAGKCFATYEPGLCLKTET